MERNTAEFAAQYANVIQTKFCEGGKMPVSAVLTILVLHWIADFILQTDKQAINKSSSNAALTEHVLVYTAFMTMFGVPMLFSMNNSLLPLWPLINGIAHWVTDYVTSRWTKQLYIQLEKARAEGRVTNDRHEFFAVIGLDQLLHYAVLFLTYSWLQSR